MRIVFEKARQLAERVIGSSLSSYSTVLELIGTTWVSIIEYVSAAGSRLKPSVIFTGGKL